MAQLYLLAVIRSKGIRHWVVPSAGYTLNWQAPSGRPRQAKITPATLYQRGVQSNVAHGLMVG